MLYIPSTTICRKCGKVVHVAPGVCVLCGEPVGIPVTVKTEALDPQGPLPLPSFHWRKVLLVGNTNISMPVSSQPTFNPSHLKLAS